ncbi:MAG TPA: N-acetylglucosamine-6-phosphate deacetylase [Blastocatellia bacterium]|nr:N-acetylglucosamine-6-phosphate deacetylase [Blastocatellia bacterium]
MASRLAIINGTVVTPDQLFAPGIVLCEDGRIQFVGAADAAEPVANARIIDATGQFVLPGFIDTHVHGSGGDDVMINGAAGIQRAGRNMLRYGTTAWLPTTIAARHEEILFAITETIKAETTAEPMANILGLHLEGPYINLKFKGAQPDEGIRDPNFDELEELLETAQGRIKVMTLAPELPGSMEMIRLLKANDIVASLGHSECDYDTALAAIDAGATYATHLFNAMSGVHHRKPGLAACCLNEPGICAELILDGVHVNPQMARLATRNKGRDGLALITDATTAQGCGDGIYQLGKFQVQVSGALCTLLDGVTIAGSVLTMNQAVKNAIEFTGMNLVDVAYMAAMMPAQRCGVADRKGSLEVGKDADIAILQADFSVAATIVNGNVAYEYTA